MGVLKLIIVSLAIAVIVNIEGRTVRRTGFPEVMGWDDPVRYCGGDLSEFIKIVCAGPTYGDIVANRRKQRLIVQDCCMQNCSPGYIRKYYCANQTVPHEPLVIPKLSTTTEKLYIPPEVLCAPPSCILLSSVSDELKQIYAYANAYNRQHNITYSKISNASKP